MLNSDEKQIEVGNGHTRVTLVVKADEIFYVVQDDDNVIKFSVTWEVFNLLRVAEDKVSRQNEAQPQPFEIVSPLPDSPKRDS